MFRSRRVLCVLAVLVLSVGLSLSSVQAEQPANGLLAQAQRWLAGDSAANELLTVWQRAREAGSYRLIADVEQTLYPRPLPELIGQSESAVDLRLEGEAHLPDRAMVTLRVEADGLDTQPVKLYRLGDQVLMSEGGELRPVDDPSSLGLVDADYLGYLAGAVDIKRSSDSDGSHYTFGVDGARLAQYQIEHLEEQLRQRGELPDGAQLSPNGALARATGQGELWVNAEGLPRRQVVTMDLPGLTEGYDARIKLTIDFSDYGCEDHLPTPVQGADGAWNLDNAAPPDPSASSGSAPDNGPGSAPAPDTPASTLPSNQRGAVRLSLFSLGLFAATLALVMVVRRRIFRRRRAYALFVSIMALALIALPLLQAGQWVLFGERTVQAAASKSDVMAAALGMTSALDAPQSAPDEPPIADTAARQLLDEGSEDSDDDGLSDAFERVLGTSPTKADTDQDGISDGIEVQGVELGGVTWTSNPNAFDSNRDDLSDEDEWPEPEGLAKEHDPDQDGVPNFWDEDNDNDDLPDSVDLSPMAVGDYAQDFSLVTQGGDTFDGYLYVEFQVQPQNEDHLRYSTTPLDWPHDEKGQMTDLNDSTEDLRLTPFMRIDSNVAPSTDLARNYGVRSWPEGDRYIIMAPLSPVSDGGKIRGFYSKVAYSPNSGGTVPDLDWNAQMVWLVQAQADVEVRDDQIITREMTLHRYVDDFRLTGFCITKSRGYDTLLLGSPGSQYEDRDALQMFLGLNGLFMEYDRLQNQAPSGETALGHLHYRFQNNWPITYTLGADVGNAASAYRHYAHEDESLGESSTDLIPDFLNDNYSSAAVCPTAEDGDLAYASLVVASEHTYGQRDLSEWEGDCRNVFANIQDIPLVRVRSTRLVAYSVDPDTGSWETIEMARLLEMVELRYRDRWDALAEELESRYPHLKGDTLRHIATVAYLSAFSGSQEIVACDETLYIEAGPVDDSAIAANYGVSDVGRTFDDLPTFFAWASGLGEHLDVAIADREREWGEDNSVRKASSPHRPVRTRRWPGSNPTPMPPTSAPLIRPLWTSPLGQTQYSRATT